MSRKKHNIGEVKCWGIRRRCALLNNPLLVEVWLGYVNLVAAFSSKLSNFLSQLEFPRLYTGNTAVCHSNADKFLSDFCFLEICFQGNMVNRRSPRLPRLKQLQVQFLVKDNRSILRFSSLIEAAPCLQKFVLELCDFRLFKKYSRRRIQEPPSHPHDQLKTVQLKGYLGTKNNLEVVMYFLKNAVALQEICY